MHNNFVSFFRDLKKCRHHKECRYADNDPASVCMNGGDNYCGVYREWTIRLEAHIQ